MTGNEATEIIVKFMDGVIVTNSFGKFICIPGESPLISPYHESLDALVPIWEEINFEPCFLRDDGEWSCEDNIRDSGNFGKSKSIEEAAAIATAKAIKELEL